MIIKKNQKTILSIIYSILLFFIALCNNCQKKTTEHFPENILVRIEDKFITEDEFKRRAEYTIRPSYCNKDNYIHKKIILNSLIAEKLFALESGEQNELATNDQFKNYLAGRKDQAMRQLLFYNNFYSKVKLDTNEIKKIYDISGRKYKINYITVRDSSIAKTIISQKEKGYSFDEIFSDIEDIPQREINWDNPEHPQIHKAMYSEPLNKNQFIGPLKVGDNLFISIKIAGWTDSRLITEFDIKNQINKIKENLTMNKAMEIYSKFVQDLMKGKKIEFNPLTFKKIVNIIGPLYLKNDKKKKELFDELLWNNETGEQIPDNVDVNINEILTEPLLKIDGNVWTVQQFKKEMNIHPLVFRKKQISKSEFAEQLKYAIADMIRDKYIAQEAENKGYGNSEAVQSNIMMWKDHLLALYKRNQYLKSLGKFDNFSKNYLSIIENDLNPFVMELQKKYDNMIEINTDIFENIELTKIDMFVFQNNVPFPVIVPQFPLLTTHNKLDYGKKLK